MRQSPAAELCAACPVVSMATGPSVPGQVAYPGSVDYALTTAVGWLKEVVEALAVGPAGVAVPPAERDRLGRRLGAVVGELGQVRLELAGLAARSARAAQQAAARR